MRFAALRAPWYKGYLAGSVLMMGGDNLEHAITYWVMWQTFHSPVLAGLAVLTHWLPHLFFAIPLGALADRFDCRRLIQLSALLFIAASVDLGHPVRDAQSAALGGCRAPAAARLRQRDLEGARPAHALRHGRADRPAQRRAAHRDRDHARAAGRAGARSGLLLFTVGPTIGMFLNVAMYLPFFTYLFVVPITGHLRDVTRRAAPHLRDIVNVLRDVPKYPSILVVMILQGAIALFIGVALMPLLPEFGGILGQGSNGAGYAVLVSSMAAGATAAGITLEAIGRIRASTRLAIGAGIAFAASILVFALSQSYPLSIAALVVAGASSLTAASTSQTIVQLEAPSDRRGRFVGAAGMTAQGFQAGSGVLIGVLAGGLGVAGGVATAATALLLCAVALLIVVVVRRRNLPAIEPDAEAPIELEA